MTNNCASYLINLATEMGVPVDTPRVTSFVTRRLMEEQGKQLANMIRGSVDMLGVLLPYSSHPQDHQQRGLRRLYSGGKDDTSDDRRIVERLVEYTMSNNKIF